MMMLIFKMVMEILLIISTYFNNLEIIKLLVEKKADINLENKCHETPLSVIQRTNNKEIIDYFSSITKKKVSNSSSISNFDKSSKSAYSESYNKSNEYKKRNTIIEVQKVEKLIEMTKKSICKIEVKNKNKTSFGTGFLIKLPIPTKNNPLLGLITNNHLIDSEYIKEYIKLNNNNSSKSLKITITFNEKIYILKLTDKKFIFTSNLIDITFIQLTEDELINNENLIFLEASPINNFKNEELIYIFQYSKRGPLSFSSGNIKDDEGFNYFHDSPTDEGSSGSPLINENMKVRGIHKSYIPFKELNSATKMTEVIYALQTIYNKRYIYDIKKANDWVRNLSRYEKIELKDHGLSYLNELQELLLPNLFEYSYSSSSFLTLLFYRTNYGWYWTLQERKEINNIINTLNLDKPLKEKYSNIMSNIKTYKWRLINPYKMIDENINDDDKLILEHCHKIIITYLKLSELMYM